MKKKLIRYITAFAVMFSGTACEEKLDLTDPQTISEEFSLSTSDNVKKVLVGGYDELASANFYGGNLMRNTELLAANDEIVFSGTYPEPFEIFNKAIVTANGNVLDTWLSGYKTINIANNVLAALDVVDPADRDQVKGEALFIRATAYFELVRLFAKNWSDGDPTQNDGVPLILTPTRELDERVTASRNTVKEVYDAVIADLAESIDLTASDTNDATRATREAAIAMLARVYMQMEDYVKARDLANQVISSQKYALNQTYADAFNGGTTPEDIFNIPVSIADGVNNMQLFYGSTTDGGRGDIEVEQKHLDLYEEGDDRLACYYIDDASGDTRTGKWVNQFGNVKIIRLAEVMLIRAEANFRLGSAAGADPLEDVNSIRERAGLPLLEAVDLTTILHERRVELAHEGLRLYDVKRLKETITEGNDQYPWNDSRLIFPIPQREINVNPNLSQNAGYGV